MFLKSYFVFMAFIQALMAFMYGMFVTSVMIEEAENVPRDALKHVERGPYVYPAFALAATFSFLGMGWKLIVLGLCKIEEARPSRWYHRRGSGLLIAWLLIDTIPSGLMMLSFILQQLATPWGTCSDPSSSGIVNAYVKTQSKPKKGQEPDTAADFCSDLITAENMTFSLALIAVHVNTVGLLLVTWPNILWLPEIPGIPTYTDDWTGGHTGLRKRFLQGLQIVTAPLRLTWRSWCRWQQDLLFVVSFVILFPILVIIRLWVDCKKLREKRRKAGRARDSAKEPSSTVQLETVYRGPGPGTSVLERLISQDDLFYNLVQQAHAVDIVRLGLTSRTARATIKQHWNAKACQKYLCNGSKIYCWGCDMTLCPECQGQLRVKIKQTEAQRQKSHLQAICTKCYFLALCAPRNLFSFINQKCTSSRHGALVATQTLAIDAPLCSICSNQGLRDQREVRLRQMHDRRIIQDRGYATTHNPGKCWSCAGTIWAFSARWWRCDDCTLECRDVKIFLLKDRMRQLKTLFISLSRKTVS